MRYRKEAKDKKTQTNKTPKTQKNKNLRFVGDVKYPHSFQEAAGVQRASRASLERAHGHALSSQLTSARAKGTRFVLNPWTHVAPKDTLWSP